MSPLAGDAVVYCPGVRQRLSRQNRELIVKLMSSGWSAAAAGREVGCNYRTVQRWWSRWRQREREDPLEDGKGGKGRPRETTEEEDVRIMEYVEQHVFCTANEIKEALGLRCSSFVIQRYVA